MISHCNNIIYIFGYYIIQYVYNAMISHSCGYPLVIQHSYRQSQILIGISTRNWPFSIAMLVCQRVKQFHKPVLYHCTMIIPLCVYIYTIDVVKTMPCLPSPSYHHFYRWYVETIRSLRGGHVQKRCRLSKAGDDLAGHGKPAPVPGG